MNSAVTTLVIIFALLGGANSFAQQSSEAEYQAKLKELQATIALIKKEINSVKSSRNKLQDKLQGSEVDISDLIKKIERLKGDLASQKKQLSLLNSEQAQLQQAKQQQEQQISQHIGSAYRMGQQGKLKLLLNQQDPNQLSRQLQYHRYIASARDEKVKVFQQTLLRLAIVSAEIIQKNQIITDDQKILKQQHSQLSLRQAERKQTLSRLNWTLANKDKQLARKARDQEQLRSLIRQLSEALANIKLPNKGIKFRQRKGKLSWPTQGKIRHRYGSQRQNAGLKWQGVFIQARSGGDVKAVHHGRVVFSEYLKGHGMLMIIDHGDNYMSLYAHNQSLFKDTGEWVNSGETIGQVGNTGGLAEAGVYFEIRHRGNPTNPASWCRG